MQDIIQIHESDNVAVALDTLSAGAAIQVGGRDIILAEDIPQGHKVAAAPILEGEAVIKYGSRIGLATQDIKPGSWVHIHNVKTGLGDLLDYAYHPQLPELEPTEDAFFQGYRRKDNKVGIRNEIWIIPTVGCVNKVGMAIEKRAKSDLEDNIKSSTKDIIAFQHPYGCSQMGEDQENTRRILANLVNHPNAGGVLVLGLGCENTNIDELKKYIGDYDPDRVKFLVAQECEDEIEEGLRLIRELATYAGSFRREEINARELVIGLKCGGSDGLSGITANPVVGRFSDLLVSKGGTTILTEVPEMFGAETILMDRCENEELFHQTVRLINDFKNYFKEHNQRIYENPSPGNKMGGITTLEDKSLGCTQKSGSSVVKGVMKYGEMVRVPGLNLLSAPGNDLVAATALAAAGAHMVLFTTGRGTPFACPVPTVKISSNSKLYHNKSNWIDFDAGKVLEAGAVDDVGRELFDYVIKAASGSRVKSEEAGYHDLAIFKQGVTL
ncbi:MAG TPA: altronate dehydratase [Clostridiales bacterium]|nr:altronate dehydratase [Clostridiales bacterium]